MKFKKESSRLLEKDKGVKERRQCKRKEKKVKKDYRKRYIHFCLSAQSRASIVVAYHRQGHMSPP